MRTQIRGGLLALMAASLVAVGCTRRFFRERADADVAEVLTEKNCYPEWAVTNFHVYPDSRARFADPTNPDRPPMPPDDPAAWDLSPHPQNPPKHAGVHAVEGCGYLDYLATCTALNRAADAAKAEPAQAPMGGALETAEPPSRRLPRWSAPEPQKLPETVAPPAPPPVADAPGSPKPDCPAGPPYKLKLDQAVELGLFNSREYQDARENLYLTALPVTLERFAFSTQFLAAGEVIRRWAGSEASPNAGNLWLADSTLGFSKLFPTGALLLFRLANDLTINLNNAPRVVATGDMSLQLAQPLLRGGGKAVTLEPLTLAERNLLYGIRSYARFRKQFYVAIAGGGEFFQPTSGSPGGATITSSNPFGTGRGVASLETIDPGPAGIVLPGRGVQPDGVAPTQGYLPTILQVAFVEDDRQNIVALERFLQMFRGFEEGGDVSPLQVGQIEQQLLQGQSQLLNDELNLRNFLDFFKLQLGLPTELPLELDNDPLRPIDQHIARFETVIEQTRDIRSEVEGEQRPGPGGRAPRPGYGLPNEVALIRGRLHRLLTDAPLTRGTTFGRTILQRLARWEAMTPAQQDAALDELRKERTKLQDERTEAEVQNREFPPARAQRLAEVEAEQRLGSFAATLALYESRSWQRRNPGDVGPPSPDTQERRRRSLFRQLVNDFSTVVTDARNERFRQLSGSWPKLPAASVDGMDLIQADLDLAQSVAGRAALNNRLDLLNARAQLVDYWRQIAVQANSLLGVLNIRYNSESFTPPGKDQPFSFSGSRTTHTITVNGELPLVRRLERNNYRAALIAYQRERRVLQATEDFVLADVRSELRQLRVLAENFRIQQRQLELAYDQVEASLDTFFAPSYPSGATTVGTIATGGLSGGSSAGSAAALTQQLINAQNSLLRAKNSVYQVWVNYLIFRLQFYRDLELMPLDLRGVWIDERASDATAPAQADARDGTPAGPGRDPGTAPERLPEPGRQPGGGRPGQPAAPPAQPQRP